MARDITFTYINDQSAALLDFGGLVWEMRLMRKNKRHNAHTDAYSERVWARQMAALGSTKVGSLYNTDLNGCIYLGE